jgi:hypothetical protein
MKAPSLFASVAMLSLMTVGGAAGWQVAQPALTQVAVAAEVKESGPTAQQKIDMIAKNKGQIGSGDQLRRFFYGDLLPISVQPGGAGMVVNLYNKANDTTFAYCATYDVIVAVKKGRVIAFSPKEVK